MSKPEDFMFDSRVRERFLRRRDISMADVQRHLEALPDLEGEYDHTETAQPAVTPPRSEVSDEPLVFDGIRRLSSLGDGGATASRQPAQSAPLSPAAAPYREPEVRTLGAPLRSALMESEISGVGAGAVSAALGAMAAEARAAVPYIPTASSGEPRPDAAEPPDPSSTPVTLRSEATPPGFGLDDEGESEVEPEPEPPPPDSEGLA